jgi:4'-phosphopantetheinyl transferase
MLDELNDLRTLAVPGKGEVQIWIARLDRGADEIAAMRAKLSVDEISRASAFHFQYDHNRFVAARSILRKLLGAYSGCPPESVRFRYNRWGKPALENGPSSHDIHFNLSHSQGLAVYAFSQGRAVGVDIETIGAGFASDGVAEQFFSQAEVAMLRSLPNELQFEAFLNCWTRKEAYVKARGEGLAIDLSSFDVSLRPGAPASLLRAADAENWSMATFRSNEGYVIAIAAEGKALRFSAPQWCRM